MERNAVKSQIKAWASRAYGRIHVRANDATLADFYRGAVVAPWRDDAEMIRFAVKTLRHHLDAEIRRMQRVNIYL